MSWDVEWSYWLRKSDGQASKTPRHTVLDTDLHKKISARQYYTAIGKLQWWLDTQKSHPMLNAPRKKKK